METEVRNGIAVAVGLLVLFAATFVYASGYYRANSRDVGWRTVGQDGPSAQETTEEGQATVRTLTIEQGNLASITFTLTWSDDVGDPDSLRLEVTGPEEGLEASSGSESDGSIEVTVPVNEVPPASEEFGPDDQVRQRMIDEFGTMRGSGAWTVTVRVASAPGDNSNPVLPVEDGEQAWSLATTLTTFEPDL